MKKQLFVQHKNPQNLKIKTALKESFLWHCGPFGSGPGHRVPPAKGSPRSGDTVPLLPDVTALAEKPRSAEQMSRDVGAEEKP